MKKMLMFFVMLIISTALVYGATPHTINLQVEDQYGNYPSVSNLDYTCWITVRSSETRDFGQTGCDYVANGGFISVNIGNFTQWNHGETLHIEVDLENIDGGPWTKEVTIDENASGNLQYFIFPSNGLQCGTYETETAVLTDDSEVSVSFDHTGTEDVVVKIDPDASISASIVVNQFDGTRTSIPSNGNALGICFDVNDSSIGAGNTVYYTFTWDSPVPTGTTAQVVVTFDGGDTWQDVSDVANLSVVGSDLTGNSTYGKTYGVKISRTYSARHEADASYAFGDGDGDDLLELASVSGAEIASVTKNTPADYDLTISWDAVPGATNYKIKYCDTYAGGTYSYYKEEGSDFVTTSTSKTLEGWTGNGFNNIDRANFIKIEACHDTYTNSESSVIAFREYNNNINSYLPSNNFIAMLFDNDQLYTTASDLGEALGNVDLIGQWDGDSWDTCQKINFPDNYPVQNAYWWCGDFNLTTTKPVMVTAAEDIKAFFNVGDISDARQFTYTFESGAGNLEDNMFIIPIDSSIYSDDGWEDNTGDALYSGLQKLATDIGNVQKIEKWNKNAQAWRVLSITDASWGDERWDIASDNDVMPGGIYRVQVSSQVSNWSCPVIGD